MIGHGERIYGDLFNIAQRIKAVDKSYYIVRNYKTRKFELHSDSQCRGSLALVIPYDKLDERTITLARKTRVERRDILMKETERQNMAIAKAQSDKIKRDAMEKLERIIE